MRLASFIQHWYLWALSVLCILIDHSLLYVSFLHFNWFTSNFFYFRQHYLTHEVSVFLIFFQWYFSIWMYHSLFTFIHFYVWRMFGLFLILAVINRAAKHSCTGVCGNRSFSVGWVHSRGGVGHMVSECLWGTPNSFPEALCCLHSFQQCTRVQLLCGFTTSWWW